MSVRYITVTPVANFFQPATRAFGDIAVVGMANPTAGGPKLAAIPITNPDSITYTATNSLAAAITDPTATSLSVLSAAGFPKPLTSFQIQIDHEVLNVTSTGGTGGTTWTVARGANSTTAATHAPNATVMFTNGTQTITTTLTAAVTAAATTIAVQSTTGFPPLGFSVQIDTETLTVTAFGGTNNTTWTVLRGAAGSTAATHAINAAVVYASKGSAVDDFAWFPGDLATSVRKVFAQSPGPTLVWAVQTDSTNADPWGSALSVSDKIDVQIVFLANTPLTTTNQATLQKLADHITTVSNTGADGMERIGVVMLANGAAPPTLTNDLTTSAARLVYVAHKSNEDAAAAIAGTIAGYQPQISLLLKPVNLAMTDTFADSEIDAFNTARINWITSPTLIPGNGMYMGEGYIRNDPNIPYIDITRTIDDVSFLLKAQLIESIGELRMTRAGLRTLEAQMASVLEPLVQAAVLDAYNLFIPLQVLLDKDPTTLTAVEAAEIQNARDTRTVDSIITVTYAGAIHRLNINLIFQ